MSHHRQKWELKKGLLIALKIEQYNGATLLGNERKKKAYDSYGEKIAYRN